jgi:hypothetical protein
LDKALRDFAHHPDLTLSIAAQNCGKAIRKQSVVAT